MEFKLFDKKRDIKILKIIAIAIVIGGCSITIKDELVWQLGEEYYEDDSYSENYSDDCNVAIIDLKGYMDIEEYEDGDVGSSDIIWAIENAEESKNIQAIILDIDSGGGVAVTGEEVSNALSRAEKPTVALIRSIGASAAYWSAIGADRIFASANSDVGSIGATMSYVDYAKQNQAEGLTYNSLSSGRFKDTGDYDKALSYEEKQYLMRDINIIADNFIKTVSEKRNLDISKVKALADGSTVLGGKALEVGLIDEIGDLYAVKQYLSNLIGEEAVICW